MTMTLVKPKSMYPRVYVRFEDALGNEKAESLTVYGATPKEARAVLEQAVNGNGEAKTTEAA